MPEEQGSRLAEEVESKPLGVRHQVRGMTTPRSAPDSILVEVALEVEHSDRGVATAHLGPGLTLAEASQKLPGAKHRGMERPHSGPEGDSRLEAARLRSDVEAKIEEDGIV